MRKVTLLVSVVFSVILLLNTLGCDEESAEDNSIVKATTPFPLSTGEDWLWVPVEGTQCMNGSQAGISVRRDADSTNRLIHFELGGACFNGNTCDTSLTVTKITE